MKARYSYLVHLLYPNRLLKGMKSLLKSQMTFIKYVNDATLWPYFLVIQLSMNYVEEPGLVCLNWPSFMILLLHCSFTVVRLYRERKYRSIVKTPNVVQMAFHSPSQNSVLWQNESSTDVTFQHFICFYQHRNPIYTRFPWNITVEYNKAEFWALSVSLFFMAFMGLQGRWKYALLDQIRDQWAVLF